MKLYVGNLPFAFTEDELKDLFAPFGTVKSAKLIIDRETGKSKGFGFVELGSKDEGQKAINEMNNKAVGNKSIVVNEARPQVKREESPFRKRSFN